jgi:hypothetical protein
MANRMYYIRLCLDFFTSEKKCAPK